jgi:hypothetical protein
VLLRLPLGDDFLEVHVLLPLHLAHAAFGRFVVTPATGIGTPMR